MEHNTILLQLKSELSEIKRFISKPVLTNPVSEKWLPRSEVMKFLQYGDTQMAALEKTGDIVITKVGKRKFILRDSITQLLDKNIQ